MKTETLLTALLTTCNLWKPERMRQQRALLERLIKRDADKDEEIRRLEQQYEDSMENWDGG